MKVVIKTKERNMKFIIPMFVLTNGVRLSKFITKKIEMDEGARKYMEILDFKQIGIALKELKDYKGLTLLEIVGADGSYVLIKC